MSTLDPKLALRIGLAARALAVTPAQLMPVLIAALKLPLTDQKLKGLTIQKLRSARPGALARQPTAALEQAILYLKDHAGVDIIDPSIPPISPYQDGDMPGSIRVAIASNEGLLLDGDFGDCVRFLIYQVSREDFRLIDIRGTAGEKGAVRRQSWRAERIRDCQLVLAISVGIRYTAQLVPHNIYPVTYLQATRVPEAIEDLQRVLRQSPPPWLAKLIEADLSDPVALFPVPSALPARPAQSFA